ncbi:hypothetical protein Droror1_Dr00023643 [Drosera rotundifolia]
MKKQILQSPLKKPIYKSKLHPFLNVGQTDDAVGRQDQCEAKQAHGQNCPFSRMKTSYIKEDFPRSSATFKDKAAHLLKSSRHQFHHHVKGGKQQPRSKTKPKSIPSSIILTFTPCRDLEDSTTRDH